MLATSEGETASRVSPDTRLIVNLTRAAVVCDQVTIADRPLRRMRGLLGRRTLPAGEGMLLQPAPSIHTAFMRFAIDVVFMDGTFRVLKVVEQLRPFRAASAHRGRTVLELAGGEAAVRGIHVGDQLAVVEVTDRVGAFVTHSALHDGTDEATRLSLVDESKAVPVAQVDDGYAAGGTLADAIRRTHVLLVTSDRRFRSVAAVLLTRRDYAVTLADRTSDVAELARRQSAEVVVFDAGSSLTEGARAVAQIEALEPEVGIVIVADQTENALPTMRVLRKWSSFDRLYSAIEEARLAPPGKYSYGRHY